MKNIELIILFSGLYLSASTVSANSELLVDSAFQISSGKYGQDTQTTIKTIPLGFTYIQDAWSLQLWASYLSVKGDGSVIPSSVTAAGSSGNTAAAANRSNPAANANTVEVVERSGIGDTSIGLSYSFAGNKHDGLLLSISTQVKLATADAKKNLGTGKTDYYLQLNGAYEKSRVIPFFTIGYVLMGDSIDVEYNDVMYGSFGIDYAINPLLNTQLIYDFREAITDDSKSFKQINASINWAYSEKWSVNFNVLAGLTSAAPDIGATIGLTRYY